MSKWVSKSINEIGEVISGSTPSTSVPLYWNGDNLWFTPLDLSRNSTIYLNTSSRRISLEGLKNIGNKLLPAHSLIISSRAPIGYLGIPLKDFTINQGCKTIIFNYGFVTEYFYYYFTQFNDHLKRFGEGTTFLEISKKDLENLKVYIPVSELEQSKIAKILSTIDNVLEKTEAAIEKYKAIKQGMMHDLFTRGIDIKTGKLRPKYKDAPELYRESELGFIPKDWVENILIRVCDLLTDGSHFSPKSTDSDFLIANVKDMLEDRIAFETCASISKKDFDNLIKQNCSPKINDVLLSKDGSIGKVILYNNNKKIVVLSSIAIMRVNDLVLPQYLYFYLKSHYFKKQLSKYKSGSALSRIVIASIKNIGVVFPKDKIEQQLIFDKLFSIEEKILSENKLVSKYLDIKQGLMQDLLTGKKRVKVNEDELTIKV